MTSDGNCARNQQHMENFVMKTAAKIFIIISMICGFWTILPLVFGIIALKKMKTEKPSTGLSVCVLIFCSLLGGLFLLLSKESEYGEVPAKTEA